MAGKSEKKRKRIVRSALDLKREKDRYMKQCFILIPVAALACLAPFLLYSTGADFADDQLIIILPTIVMFLAAMALSDRAMRYQKAKKRFAEYCRENGLGKE